MGLHHDLIDETGSLLVTAAAGGVGAVVGQLARALTDLTVIGTASRPETVDFARRMGAHHVVDHHQALLPQLLARWCLVHGGPRCHELLWGNVSEAASDT
ncbi:hypothetical protein ACWDE9_14330 [Streptomyces olivaceoviridis]